MKFLFAVLEDAIRCYLRNAVRRKESAGATSWRQNRFKGRPRDRRQPFGDVFSFDDLCSALGIGPRGLLASLRISPITNLPSRRYQMRRHRPLSSLRDATGYARPRLGPLSRLVTLELRESNCHRVALPWNSPGVASTAITLRGRTKKIGPMSSTVSAQIPLVLQIVKPRRSV